MNEQLFYVFDEHTDYLKECRKNGFCVYKVDNSFDNELELGNIKYIVLGRNECYSGWEINIVQQKEFSFKELLYIALTSRIYDEKVVAVGLILKNYYSCFINEIRNNFQHSNLNHSGKKLLKLILNEISQKSYQVGNMKELLNICSSLLNKTGDSSVY